MKKLKNIEQINFTDVAFLKIKELIKKNKNTSLNFRISIKSGGCSGFQYKFSFDDKIKKNDIIINNNNIYLIVDKISFKYLIGSYIDYKDDIEGAYFFIKNPNAKHTCSCGLSFST